MDLGAMLDNSSTKNTCVNFAQISLDIKLETIALNQPQSDIENYVHPNPKHQYISLYIQTFLSYRPFSDKFTKCLKTDPEHYQFQRIPYMLYWNSKCQIIFHFGVQLAISKILVCAFFYFPIEHNFKFLSSNILKVKIPRTVNCRRKLP